jgi:hypothetical protein
MSQKTSDATKQSNTKKHVEREFEGGTAGALAGAAVGAIAGPPGAIAGAVVGAIAGAFAGRAVEDQDEARTAEDARLDDEIGVGGGEGGEMGAPNLEHPPAKIGAYSGGSTGVASSGDDESPAEGPIQPPRK